MHEGTLKQILLITDGCSNQGEDPVAVAALAREQGITVNVIGVLDRFDSEDGRGLQEVEGIAAAGGGISQIVETRQLSQTVQMVTKQAMTQTIKGVINRELQDILGESETVENLSPEKQGKIMEVVDELGETMNLDVCILVDTSASMKSKLPTVREALQDLSMSLTARMGSNQFCLLLFPGKRKAIQKITAWTADMENIERAFDKIGTHGVTPTGPALKEAVKSFSQLAKRNLLSHDEAYDDRPR
ncbi:MULTISPECIES: vWA domain-containing protein [unclassified Sporolactobacillus]|uniref:vWA domain-containing protein n=1 Tax=unclassified Sporolactobacillus TaxID=2628533 RepID=UPI002367C5FD|nr:VWA domain-containing protein [Sporolactobacillus sp. CQH2019]MDD9150705.1 VWA domain-containing protein [Sporolactobacillus sp. CQH2019]